MLLNSVSYVNVTEHVKLQAQLLNPASQVFASQAVLSIQHSQGRRVSDQNIGVFGDATPDLCQVLPSRQIKCPVKKLRLNCFTSPRVPRLHRSPA